VGGGKATKFSVNQREKVSGRLGIAPVDSV
jgi:hypothetical protein